MARCKCCAKEFRQVWPNVFLCSTLCAQILVEELEKDKDVLQMTVRRLRQTEHELHREKLERPTEPTAFTLEYIRKIVDGG